MSAIYVDTPGTWCVLRCARCAQLRGPPPSEQSHDQRPPPPASSASIATRPGPATGSPGAGVGFLTNGHFTAGSHHIFTLGPSTIKVTIINHALFKSHSSPPATRDTCHGC